MRPVIAGYGLDYPFLRRLAATAGAIEPVQEFPTSYGISVNRTAAAARRGPNWLLAHAHA
ncbi:MAG TPA: hypothetical protein VIY69_03320 [Candidatus Acidoferrales bacterium]